MRFTVAIDGPAAAGKGTISKAVARAFGFAHLDTGLLYRATGRKVLETGLSPEDAARAITTDDLKRDGLRTQAVAELASQVAAIPEVRAALVTFQREFARREGEVVEPSAVEAIAADRSLGGERMTSWILSLPHRGQLWDANITSAS